MIAIAVSFWIRFKLLLWKNWRVHIQNRVSLMFVVLAPAFFGLILVVLRILVEVEKEPASTYRPSDLVESWKELMNVISYRKEEIEEAVESFEHNVFVPRLIVGYAPNKYEGFRKIMLNVESYLPNTEIRSFENCTDLRERMTKEHYLAGVCFDTEIMTMKPTESKHLVGIYPNQLKYALIFPSELRIYYDTYIGHSWETNTLYDLNENRDQRNPNHNNGGYVGYIREGFISLQNAISLAYIHLVTGKPTYVEIRIQRFPFGRYDYDAIYDRLNVCLSVAMFMGLIYPIFYFAKFLVLDKEDRMETILRFMGADNFVSFLAWFVHGFLFFSISSLVVVAILKVHWYGGLGICTNSSWTALFFFLQIYNISALCFAFMVCSFFSDTLTALTVLAALWFLSFIPFIMANNLHHLPMSVTFSACLFSNTAMGLAFKDILEFERFDAGFHWHSYFDSKTIETKMSVGVCILTFLLSSVIYTSIGLLAPNIKFRTWNMWTCGETPQQEPISIKTSSRRSSRLRMSDVYEVNRKESTVKLKKVSKEYKGLSVLKDISFELFESEISVLMGHNAAGKTTLLSMIIGITTPTSGKVIRHGFDVSKFPTNVRHCIGFYLDGVGLCNDLSVRDQLTFFSLMKGATEEQAEAETQKFLLAMELRDDGDVLTKDLTLGKRHLLAVCCAFTGDSNTIVLDEPSTGMDIPTRRLLWDILNSEKKDRTVLIVTNDSEEVECFADRVTIISGGQLKCNGSIKFLKKIYGNSYRLICVKSSYCKTEAVTAVIQQHIPDIIPECDLNSELSFLIDSTYVDRISELLTELEKTYVVLGLEYFWIRELGLENIFLQMGAENASDGGSNRHRQIMNGETIYAHEFRQKELPFLKKYTRLEGFKLRRRQWQVMFRKHLLYFVRNKTLAILQMFVPIFLVCAAFGMTHDGMERHPLKPMTFELDQYPKTISVVDIRDHLDYQPRKIFERYRRIVFWEGTEHQLEDTGNETMLDFMTRKLTYEKGSTNRKYMIGATFSNDLIIAWFSNYPLHTAPLSLNMIHSALLRSVLDDNAAIVVSHDSLPYSTTHDVKLQKTPLKIGHFMAYSLTLGLCCIWSIPVIFLVKERNSRFKLLQFISGVDISTYWLSTFVFDMLKVTIMCISITLTIAVLNYFHVHYFNITICFFVLLMTAGACIVSSNYLMSIFFTDPVTAYTVIIYIGLFGGVFYSIFTAVLRHSFATPIDVPNTMLVLARILPYFSLGNGLMKTSIVSDINNVCADTTTRLISIVLERCNMKPDCCQTLELWTWNRGVLPELLSLVIIGSVSWILLFCMEYRRIHHSGMFMASVPERNSNAAFNEHKQRHVGLKRSQRDSVRERIKLETLRRDDWNNAAIIFNQLGMKRSKGTVIPGLYMNVNRAECFGFIGESGSGKSAILKMLVGDEPISYGRAYIEGISFNDGLYKVYKRIGYSPQVHALLDDFRICEVMEIFCGLRGIPADMSNDICVSLGKLLGFFTHFKKSLVRCTTGLKKRVSWANAILSNPSVIVLDDPCFGVDLAGMRQLLAITTKMRRQGSTVLIATPIPRECERACDRVAIISKGRMLCIGNPFELNDRYMKGYILRLKVKPVLVRTSHRERRATLKPFLGVQTFVENEFPNSTLKDHRGQILIYFIPCETAGLAAIFHTVQQNTVALNIEDFNITRANLTTVFIELMEDKARWSYWESQII